MKTPSLASLVLASLASVSVQAATVTMDGSNTSSESWNTAADWSDDTAPSAGNDYVVGAGFQVRSPGTASQATFAGNSLSVGGAGASLLLRTQTGGYTSSVGTLTISNGAAIRNGYSAGGANQNTQVLNGSTLTFLGGAAGFTLVQTGGTAGAQASSTGPRNFTFNALVQGDGEVRLQDRGTITLTNAANAFAGTWVVGGGPNNTTSELVTRMAHGAGEGSFFGTGASVTLSSYSYLDLNFDWTTSGALTLSANGGDADAVKMKFANNITVGSLSIAGTALDEGTYSFLDLSNAGFASYFDGTTGSITVGAAVPEPSAWAALAGCAALATAASRRRGRRA